MAQKVKISRFSSSQNAPGPPSGRLFLLALAALVLLIAGFIGGRAAAGKSERVVIEGKTRTIGDAASKYGPKSTKGVVPVGFEHSSQGAVTAASAYVGTLPKLYILKDSVLTAAITQFISDDYITDFRESIGTTKIQAQAVFKEDPNAYYREFPLGYTLITSEKDKVTVQLWSLVMLAAMPELNGNTESTLHTMDLVWENGDWKVAKWSTAPGPTPRWQSKSTPLNTEDFLEAIEPYEGGYNYVPNF